MIRCGQLAQPARPRRCYFVAVRSAARTVQIGRAAVVLRKTPFSFRKSTRAPDVLSDFFTKNASCYFQIDAQSRTDAHWFVCKKDLHFIEIQPALHRHSHHFLRKHPLIFLKSKNSLPLIISFLFSKKNMWGPCTARMGAPEGLVGMVGSVDKCRWMLRHSVWDSNACTLDCSILLAVI